MTCLHPWAKAHMPSDGTDMYKCSNCNTIYRSAIGQCPRGIEPGIIKCQRARQVATARKVG